MGIQFLESIRRHELNKVLPDILSLDKQLKILEIGAGSGWQSKELAKLGYEVKAIDLDSSSYVNTQVFPVKNYDGYKIPFESEQFDLIFINCPPKLQQNQAH